MHVKIQGGGKGRYSNTESSVDCVEYLEHEDLERLAQGKTMEQFFSRENDFINSSEVTHLIDTNKQKLCKTDAKFFVLTISPNESEIKALGSTPEEQAINLRAYVRQTVMNEYALNFNKGLTQEDIRYFGKIHHERKNSFLKKDNMHVHVIVSRKTENGRLKVSPQTNHRNTTKGTVKGGFDRSNFFQKCEEGFDLKFGYRRAIENSYAYFNTMKNGSLEQQKELIRKRVEFTQGLSNPLKLSIEEILRHQYVLEKKLIEFIRITPTISQFSDEKMFSIVQDYMFKENIIEEMESILKHDDFDSKLWKKVVEHIDQLRQELKEQQKKESIQKRGKRPRL